MLGAILPVAATVALLAPGVATAATKPGVSNAAAADIGQSRATLTGRVDPNGAETVWFFQIGTTSLYGSSTAEVSAGRGNRPRAVTAPVTGLAPATTYHFRLVARNRRGVTKGADHTVKTRRQPLGVSLAATPASVAPGGSTTLSGQLTGTGNAGRQVVLQANPFPFTQGFVNAGDVHLTDSTGRFSFPILSVPLSTQFRVVMPTRPEIVSPVVIVGALVQVSIHASNRRRLRRGVSVRFHGSIRPARAGASVVLQRLRDGAWVTARTTHARSAPRHGSELSTYSVRVRVRRSARFRVLVLSAGDYVTNASRELRVRVRRRR